ERLRRDDLTGRAIERVVEAVAVREHHYLARLSRDRDVGKDRDLRRVPIFVAFPALAVIVRARIAGSVKNEVLLRIVRAGHPNASAADLPRIACPVSWPGSPGPGLTFAGVICVSGL